jgi:hypothetical protein
VKDGKRPSFQFYPDDHLADAALRACSVAARGVWWDMVCYMHQGHPYGHLTINGRVTTDNQLSLMMGGDREVTMQCIRELEEAGVFSRDASGVIFCRRMVRDEAARQMRVECGKAGGSVALGSGYNKPGYVYAMLRQSDGAIKIGASTKPKQRIYRIRLQFPGDQITMLGQSRVDDMGTEEGRLHQVFAGKASGEWFTLSGQEVTQLIGHLGGDRVGDQRGDDGGRQRGTGGVVPKQSLPPSSSSSSPSPSSEYEYKEPPTPLAGDSEPRKPKRSKAAFDAHEIELPSKLQTPELLSLWGQWIDHRNEIRKPLTPTAAQQQIETMSGWGADRAVKALRHSIGNGWQGMFEPDQKQAEKNKIGPGQKYDPSAVVGGI